MANKFYELGRRGYKLPKDKLKSGLESFVSSIDNTVSDMLKTSQDKTTSLLADMPQGVPIDKVPEQLRIKATEFLTKNKTAYTDATKVIASGINAQSQRYKDAVEVINRVNTRFENLSGSLEALALKRQASLDDPYGYSSGTPREDRLTWSNLGNGDLYDGMTFNEDGTINYTDSQGKSKPFADFNVTPQNFEGRNIFLGLNDKFTNAKYSGKTKNWSLHAGEAKFTINQLALKIKPSGQKDMMMSDTPYLESIIGFESGTPEYEAGWDKIEQNPTDAIDGYFNTEDGYLITTLKDNYNAQSGPAALNEEKTTGFTGKQMPGFGYVKGPVLDKNRLKIDNRTTYGDYDGLYGEYKYNAKDDTYTLGEGDDMEVLTPFEVAKREGVARPNETEKIFKQASAPKKLFGSDETFFQQTEEDFITGLEKNYDMSDYIVSETPDSGFFGTRPEGTKNIITGKPFKGLQLPGFDDAMGDFVRISDKFGKVLFDFKTNITNPAKRVAEAKKFNKWIEKNNIKLKSKLILPDK
tara:strand:+ start:153 stop:1727 length:1575 start_codon:yes stop_codon:yes gene_type:complete